MTHPTQLLDSKHLLQNSMLSGHKNSVTSVAMSGDIIVSGSDDGTVRIWSVEQQKEIATLKGHSGIVYSVAIEGDKVVSGSSDKSIKVWSISEQKEIATLKGHRGSVYSVVIEGDKVVSGSSDKSIKVWSILEQKEIAILKGHSGSVRTVTIDGDMVVSGSYDKSIKVWSIKKQKEIATLKGHRGSVYSVVIDGDKIVSGSEDDSIKVWSIEQQKEIATLKGHSDTVYSVAIDGDRIVSGSRDKSIKVWSIEQQKEIATLKGHSDTVLSVAIKGDVVVSGSKDKSIKVWSISEQKEIAILKGHSGSVRTVTIDGDMVVSGSYDKSIKVWSIEQQKEIATLKGHSGSVYSVSIKGDRVVSGSEDASIKVWSISEQKEISTLKGHSGSVRTVTIDGDMVVSGSYDTSIKVWSIEQQKEIATLQGHMGTVLSVAIDGDMVVSGSSDDSIKVWSIEQQKEIATLQGHSRSVASVAIEGDRIVSGSRDKSIKVWSIEARECIATYEEYGELVAYQDDVLMVAKDGVVKFVDISDVYEPKSLDVVLDAKNQVISIAMRDGYYAFATSAGDLYVDKLSSSQEVMYESEKNRYSIKTLLLGDSGVGKTTLANYVVNEEFDESIISTHGMQFFVYRFKEALKLAKISSNNAYFFELDMWDFGGQPTYQIAHKQNFDKTRVVLLVVDMSREYNNRSVNYWIQSIKEHLPKMKKDELHIAIVGTKSKDKTRDQATLQSFAQTIEQKVDNHIEVSTHLVDVSLDDTQIKELIAKLQKFIKSKVSLKDEHILSSASLRVVDEVERLQKSRFVLKNAQEITDSIEARDKQPYKGIESDVANALEMLCDNGKIEMIGEYIILKPYWKNIFTTAILNYAQSNQRVYASISIEDLLNYRFDVKFSKPLKSQEIDGFVSDQQIYDREFAGLDDEFKKEFIFEILETLLRDKICYIKNSMCVFPSRFIGKQDSFDTKGYHKISDISLVSKKNVEVSISTLVSCLYYSDTYKILKHLDKGVKLQDRDNNLFLMEFSREDMLKESEYYNQDSTTITIYAKQDTKQNDSFVSFVRMILQESLASIYESSRMLIKDEDGFVYGEVDISSSFSLDKCLHIESRCDEYVLEDISSRYGYEKRDFYDLMQKIEDKHQALLEQKDSLWDRYTKDKSVFKILHLSDLHFGSQTDMQTELIYLKQEIGSDDIDYVVLSGDLTAHASARDFEMVSKFIEEIIAYAKIDAQKVLIIPGNHDYSRDITHNAYSIESMRTGGYNPNKDFKVNDSIFLKRDDTKWKDKFKNFSEYLYEALYHHSYSKDVAWQTKLMMDEKLAFVLINTSSQIDHFNQRKVTFDIDSFVKISEKIPQDRFKIAIGHHPVNYEDSYKFSAGLIDFDYRLYMHGHVHRNNLIAFGDMIAGGEDLIYVGAGLFSSVDGKSMIPGVALRFNLITIDTAQNQLTVETRERESIHESWKKAYIYPNKSKDKSFKWEKKYV